MLLVWELINAFFLLFPSLLYFFYLWCFACCSIRNFWKASYLLYYFFFVSALVPFFCLYFFFLSRGKGEPARSSNATATSCCSLPIQPSSVQHPLFESRRIEHKAPSFCLFSLTPGLAASLHQHNISSAVFLTHNLECSTPPHLHSLLYLMSSSTHCMGDVWFSTHFKP